MIQMFAAYRQDNEDVKFKFIHVFTRIEMCEKWRETLIALAKAKNTTYDPSQPAPPASERRPIGNKKAKAARDAAPGTERLHACFEKCMTEAAANPVKREADAATRWRRSWRSRTPSSTS